MLADNGALHDGNERKRETWLKASRSGGHLQGGHLQGGLAIGFGLASAALVIAQCWLIARIVAGVIIDRAALADVAVWFSVLGGVIACRFVIDTLKRGFAFEAALAVKTRLRLSLFDHIVAIGPAGLQQQQPGDLIGVMTAAIDDIEGYFSGYLPQKMLAGLIPLLILIVVFPFDWVSGVILLITLPILPIFMIIVGKGAERLNRRQWKRLAAMAAHFFDVIAGLTTLRQLGASRREALIVARVSEDYRKTTMSVLRVAFLSSLVLEFFATISVAMVAVYIGFRLYYGEMLFLPGLFALLLAPEFFRPLRDMGTQYHARMTALAAAEKLIWVFDLAAPEPHRATLSKPPKQLADGPVSIAFDKVTFHHADGGGVRDISLTVDTGECIAIAGPSGAGKTTLARLLLGFLIPSAGHITVNGTDLQHIDRNDWFSHIGWVAQRPTLFPGSIRDNIALARPDAPQEAVEQAARVADAHAMIEALPERYETILGADGQGLSGGQMQRIAIARAVLNEPQLLILDEPSAALDRKTAETLLVRLRTALPQASLVIITHDRQLAEQAERVVTVDDGRIAGIAAAGGAAR